MTPAARAIATRYSRHSSAWLRATVRQYSRVTVASAWPQGRYWVTARRVAKLELLRRGATLSAKGGW